MSKIELPTITSGYNLSAINSNFQKIEDALNGEALYRTNHVGEPNEMHTNLDMNGKEVLNASVGSSPGSLATKGYVDQEVAEERDYVNQQLSLVNSELDTKYDKSGGPVFGSMQMQGNHISGLPSATQLSEPATYEQLLQIESGTDSLLRNDLAAPGGASLVGFLQTGVGSAARNSQDKMRDVVSVRDFLVVGDGTDETTKFAQAATEAADRNLPLDLQGLTILVGGSFSYSTPGKKVIWRNGDLKLSPGAKTNPTFLVANIDTVDVRGIGFDGNRANVSGNNAGFFVVNGVDNVEFDDIKIRDLYRYGINVGSSVACKNVRIGKIVASDVGVQSAGVAVANGEVIMVQNSKNVEIDGFNCTNPSGTGDGQLLKVFYCENVKLDNIDLTDASPSKVYPALSCVHNTSVEYGKIKVSGACQVAMENNSNINQHYRAINTVGTDRALLAGTDGGAQNDRHSEHMIIENWTDTSTQALAFSLLGVKGLKLRNVSTPQTINISRDNPTDDRRSEDIEFDRVSCTALNTLLVNGTKIFSDTTVSGLWTNTGVGVAHWIDSSYGSYTNSSQTNVFLCRENGGGDVAHIFGTMTASGGTFDYRANTGIDISPFSGEVLCSTSLGASPATQWSKIHWDFYDAGTPAVLKTVRQSGSTPRANIAMTVARSTRTLTFTNTETSDIQLTARVLFINKNLAAQ